MQRNPLPGFDPEGKSGQGQESCWGPEPRHDVGLGDKTTELPAREHRGMPGQRAKVNALFSGPCGPPSLRCVEKVHTTPFGAGGMRLEPLLGDVVTASSAGFRILESQDILLGTRRDLREGKLRDSRVPGGENGLHLKQERLQLDMRWNCLTILVRVPWNELLKAILQP